MEIGFGIGIGATRGGSSPGINSVEVGLSNLDDGGAEAFSNYSSSPTTVYWAGSPVWEVGLVLYLDAELTILVLESVYTIYDDRTPSGFWTRDHALLSFELF